MSNIFFAADHHFFHQGVLNFTRKDGVTKLREFSCVEQMNLHMVTRHNAVVRTSDTVYFLGDVMLSTSAEKMLSVIPRMNGRKILIKGNHDIQKLATYAQVFSDVRAIHGLDGLVLSHVPLHPTSLTRWGTNVHGHIHDQDLADYRYYCVSMERLDNYAPISLSQLKCKIAEKQAICFTKQD